VLVAEDNPVNQQVAVGLLEQRGFAVDVADDGSQALSVQNGATGHRSTRGIAAVIVGVVLLAGGGGLLAYQPRSWTRRPGSRGADRLDLTRSRPGRFLRVDASATYGVGCGLHAALRVCNLDPPRYARRRRRGRLT